MVFGNYALETARAQSPGVDDTPEALSLADTPHATLVAGQRDLAAVLYTFSLLDIYPTRFHLGFYVCSVFAADESLRCFATILYSLCVTSNKVTTFTERDN